MPLCIPGPANKKQHSSQILFKLNSEQGPKFFTNKITLIDNLSILKRVGEEIFWDNQNRWEFKANKTIRGKKK